MVRAGNSVLRAIYDAVDGLAGVRIPGLDEPGIAHPTSVAQNREHLANRATNEFGNHVITSRTEDNTSPHAGRNQPRLSCVEPSKVQSMLMRFCALLLACVALNAQDQPIGRGVNFYSKEKEAALGAQLAGEVRQKITAIDSAAVQDYVARLGARLIAQIPDTGFTFTFTVAAGGMDGGIHEPLALPGGYIFVPASLFLAARNEAEFAGMLAHSIAHVAARHGTRQATRGEVVNIASVPLVYMGGWTGYALQQSAAAAIPLGFLRFQRALELEADRLAIGMMAGAGCDPHALVRYIGRVNPPWELTQEAVANCDRFRRNPGRLPEDLRFQIETSKMRGQTLATAALRH